MISDSTPAFEIEKEALKTEIETGIQAGVDHLEAKTAKRKDADKYHNTRHLLKQYRKVAYAIQISEADMNVRMEMEHGTRLSTLEVNAELAGVDLSGSKLEGYARTVIRSKNMLQIIDNALNTVRMDPDHGELMYQVLYLTYFSKKKPANREVILAELDRQGFPMSMVTYHRINEKRQGVNTMNLKEAFRFQNKLQSMMTDAQSILGNNGNITKVQNTYLRHKVMAEAEDEVTMEAPSTEYSENITEMAEFLLFLLDEREKLSAAIHQAKVSLPLGAGLDGEVSLNGKRQEIATLLRHMAGLRNGEVLISNGGVGYRFNNEGNQVSYRCDVKRVTTINFDRNKIRKMCADLSKKSDETSAALDAALVNTPVEYEAPFDVNETFAETFEAHMSALS